MKKAVSPVIAMVLLFVVVIFGIIAYQNFVVEDFTKLSSSLNEDLSERVTDEIRIDLVTNETIYLYSQEDNILLFELKINNQDCISNQVNLSKGLNEIDYDINCLENLSTIYPEALLMTNDGFFSKTILISN